MPTQRRFEGSTLAAVLATVQKEIGANAKIVSARKIRTGGFMGFFQRERYEVLVDTAVEQPVNQDPAPGAMKPASLLELAESINNSEKKLPAQDLPQSPSFKAESPKAQKPDVKRPNISTESDTFADILSRVAYQAHLTTEDRDRHEAERSAESAVQRASVNESSDAIDTEATVKGADPVSTTQPANTKPARRTAAAVERPAVVDRTVQDVAQPVRTRITDSPLARIGLPAQYIPATYNDGELDKALLVALKALPEVPKVEPTKGSIIAVVGERGNAARMAEQLCERWGCDTDNVVVASRQSGTRNDDSIIRSTRQAENSRRSWSRRKEPTLVAIDAEPGSNNTAWAERMLAAFEPIATWGVTDATRKSEDVSVWADSLGGIDCLAVNGAAWTVSPASILATGIPVDTIDGRPATPACWTALISERLQTI